MKHMLLSDVNVAFDDKPANLQKTGEDLICLGLLESINHVYLKIFSS